MAGATLRISVQYNSAAFTQGLVTAQRALATRVAAGMRKAGERAKDTLRAQARAAGLGERLANAVRAEVYPQSGASLRPALYTFGRSALLDYFTDGGFINAQGYLLIPTAEAEARGFASTTVDRWGNQVPAQQLRRVARPDLASREFALETRMLRNGSILIVGFPKSGRDRRRDSRGVPLFVGLKRVRIPRLLDFSREHAPIARIVGDEVNRAVGDNIVLGSE